MTATMAMTMTMLDHIFNMDSLYRSWQKVSMKNACGGLDGVDISLYRADLRKNLRSLQTAVLNGCYRPCTERVYAGNKGRMICISCVDDKIVQTILAYAVAAAHTPARGAHGYIAKRSVFTAKKTLDDALDNGVSEYSKVDIRHFYDSIDCEKLFSKVTLLFSDEKLLGLMKQLIDAHNPGISTGSCLSPILSNLYLADFDRDIETNSVFYARYVDDMLVSPASNVAIIKDRLAEEGLEINTEKSMPVNAGEGFRYLGFDIKRDIDGAIMSGNFSLADKLYKAQECDIAVTGEPQSTDKETKHEGQPETEETEVTEETDESDEPDEADEYKGPEEIKETVVSGKAGKAGDNGDNGNFSKKEYQYPATIRNVVEKCHVVKTVVNKANAGINLDFGEKSLLLQLFHCLGDDGAEFIHHVLSLCADYDYAETQRRINKYGINNPIGCKKLCERAGVDYKCKCKCTFTAEKLYPTPIIHALRVDRQCFTPAEPKDSIGHFKARNPKDKAVDALSAMLDLNKRKYEIAEQQKILKGQIEDLFERTSTSELMTPHGLMLKSDDGIFLKVG